ncbi:protein trapped in endoderm-1-like [Ornithodoros turicata]|uniref:protein trapped in endoderm-1-like n=1 Tax=Ornithodoros turicata TaxID=34597 RepID=UPI003138EFCD
MGDESWFCGYDPEGDHQVLLYPEPLTQFAGWCCVLFTVLGIPGNLITLLSLSQERRLRSATTVFVLSLAAADFLFCSINLPLTACRYFRRTWPFGDSLCVLFGLFFYGNMAASILSMMAITVTRFMVVYYPVHYKAVFARTSVVALMVATLWVISFLSLLPTLSHAWGRFGLEPTTFSCTILPDAKGHSPKKLLFTLGFVVPCVVILVSYSCIFFKVRKSHRNIAAHSATEGGQERFRRDEMRITRLMLTVFCLFLLCFLPLTAANVFDSTIKYPGLHVLASVLAWMSCCVNPIVYVLVNYQYRTAYKAFLCHALEACKRFSSPTAQTRPVKPSTNAHTSEM